MPGEDEATKPGTRKPPEIAGKELPTAPLRVGDVCYLRMEITNGDRPAAMGLPPDREEVGDRLPAGVMLLRFTGPFCDVSASKREQGVAHPPPPSLKAAESPPLT